MPDPSTLTQPVALARKNIGVVFKLNKFFSSEYVIVMAATSATSMIVKSTGETNWIPNRKLNNPVAFNHLNSINSHAGRLYAALKKTEIAGYRTPMMESAISNQLEKILEEPVLAFGLVVDRKQLGLSLPECLELRVDDWRVRYEFLQDETSEDLATLRSAIISDPQAPSEIRMLVALQMRDTQIDAYLCDSEEQDLADVPQDLHDSLRVLRAEFWKKAEDVEGIAVAKEMFEMFKGEGNAEPSEQLLADKSLWPALIKTQASVADPSGPNGEDFAGLQKLSQALDALFEWRWQEAIDLARQGLRWSKREAVRDELLNLTACALWLQGAPESALSALDNALEGAYTESLLINASVVASELEHDSAMPRLLRLAREAPNAQQRAVAAERALVLWDNDQERLWEETETEELPAEIRDVLRTLISAPLPEDRYLRLMRVIANRDSAWLSQQHDRAFGPNVNSPATRVFRALTNGLDQYVQALGVELRKEHPVWVANERDSVVDAAIQVLIQNNSELGAAFFGVTILDSDMPLRDLQRIKLKSLTVVAIAGSMQEDGNEPQTRFIDWIEEAKTDLALVDAEERLGLTVIVDLAASVLAESYYRARYFHLNQVHRAWSEFLSQFRILALDPYRTVNMVAVKKLLVPMIGICKDSEKLIARLINLVSDSNLRDGLNSLNRDFSSLRTAMQDFRG